METKKVERILGHAPTIGETFDNETSVHHGIVERVTLTRYRVAMVMANKVIVDVIDHEVYDDIDNFGIAW